MRRDLADALQRVQSAAALQAALDGSTGDLTALQERVRTCEEGLLHHTQSSGLLTSRLGACEHGER